MKLPNPNDDPIIARINNTMPMRKGKKRKYTHIGCGRNANSWRRKDLSILIPKQTVVFGQKECDHEWVPAPRMMNEHTTYECMKCGMDDGCA
jgi:hypothetical protein